MRLVLGWIAIIAGVLGSAVCLLLIPGIWTLHGSAPVQAAGLIVTLDEAFGVVDKQLAAVNLRIDGAERRLASLRTRAQTMAVDPTLGNEAGAALLAEFDSGVGADYAVLREHYLAVRSQAEVIVRMRDRLAQISGASVASDEVVEQAARVDAALQALDGELIKLRATIESGDLPLNEAAARVAEQVGGVEKRVTNFRETIGAPRYPPRRPLLAASGLTASPWSIQSALTTSQG